MAFNKNCSKWWRGFLACAPDESFTAVDFLRQRYVEEMQRIERFMQHAKKEHYSQYREKFPQMATEKSRHAERIGKKIVALKGRLPDVRSVAQRTKTVGNLCRWLSTKKIARPTVYQSNSGD